MAQSAPVSRPCALLIGDSNITSVINAIGDPTFPNLYPFFRQNIYETKHFCKSGALISMFTAYLPEIKALNPAKVFISMGGNDLMTSWDEESVVRDLVGFAELVASETNCEHVYIASLHARQKSLSLQTAEDVEEFKHKMMSVNTGVEKRCMQSKFKISLWRCKGMINPTLPVVGPDGVHLTPKGVGQVYRNIRRALVKGHKDN